MGDKKRDEAKRLAATLQDEERDQEGKFQKADELFGARSQAAVPRKKEAAPATRIRTVKNIYVMPLDDHAIIEQMQERFLGARVVMNNSEVVRAGLHKLFEVTDKEELRQLRQKITKIKTGRPS